MKATLIQHCGSDEMVVRAARVSFAKDLPKGVLDDKDEKLIKYLADHNHMCYDDQTEVLTDRGWILFKDLTYSDNIAAIDKLNRTINWETPIYIYKNNYTGTMYYFESSHINFCVTPKHRFLAKKSCDDNYNIYNIDDIWDMGFRIPTSTI